MAFPALDDPRLEILVGFYVTASNQLGTLMSQLLDLPPQQRFAVMQRVQNVLRQLQDRTERWAAFNLPRIYKEADDQAIDILRRAGLGEFLASEVDAQAIEGLGQGLLGPLEKARQSVEFQATKIFRSTSLAREFPSLALQAERRVAVGLTQRETFIAIEREIASTLRQTFSNNVVSILGSDGRRHRFGLDFYAAMVAQNARSQARSAATVVRARQAGHDLVRVTANKSLTGDWCDAYRGRVYSLSGESNIYPWIGLIPNGGPPFHPWCRHGMTIFIPAFHSEAQQRAFADTQSRFLMRPNERDPNRVIRAWNEAVKLEGEPAPLRVV